MKITNHHELRRDVSIDCSYPILTDQSNKNACDINVIMANYAKTGMLSHVSNQTPKYIDCTTIPNLEQAYKTVYAAEEAFYDLPPDIRRLMDNDPSQLENFISNPENAYILEKNGLITLKKSDKIESTAKTEV
jgi:phage internal scaffolding protein